MSEINPQARKEFKQGLNFYSIKKHKRVIMEMLQMVLMR